MGLVKKESYHYKNDNKKQKHTKNKENEKYDDFVLRSGDIPTLKKPKQVGSYKLGKSFHIFFDKKPNSIHRLFTKLLLGWEWQDQK
jgi:hypothetical protein